jgi:hypothetical protein
MRSRVGWTMELDAQLRCLRADGMTWDRIAETMALGRNTVLERGRKIGARREISQVATAEEEPRDRLPRQAGHPVTWNLINLGTVLEGTPYPYPVFL